MSSAYSLWTAQNSIIEANDNTIETWSFTMNSVFCKYWAEAKRGLNWMSLCHQNLKLCTYQGNKFCVHNLEGREGTVALYMKYIYLLVLSLPVVSLCMHSYIQHKLLTCNDWVISNCWGRKLIHQWSKLLLEWKSNLWWERILKQGELTLSPSVNCCGAITTDLTIWGHGKDLWEIISTMKYSDCIIPT